MASTADDSDDAEDKEYAEDVSGIKDGRASKGADGVWRFETLKQRKCRDVPCLLIFAVLWLVTGLLTSQAIDKGNPARLVYATDYKGDVCGAGTEEANRYIYYPALHSSLLPIGRCLPACPLKGDKVCVPVQLPSFGALGLGVGAVEREVCDVLASDSYEFAFRCLRFTQYRELLTVQCQRFAGNATGNATLVCPASGAGAVPAPPPGKRFVGALAGAGATELSGSVSGAVYTDGVFEGAMSGRAELVDSVDGNGAASKLMRFEGTFEGNFSGSEGALNFSVTGDFVVAGSRLTITRCDAGAEANYAGAGGARRRLLGARGPRGAWSRRAGRWEYGKWSRAGGRGGGGGGAVSVAVAGVGASIRRLAAASSSASASTNLTSCAQYAQQWPLDASSRVQPCSLLGNFRKIQCGSKDDDAQDAAVQQRCEQIGRSIYPHCTEFKIERGKYTDDNVQEHPIYALMTAGGETVQLWFGELQKASSLVYISGGLLAAVLSLVWVLNVQRLGSAFIECLVMSMLVLLVLTLVAISIVCFVTAGTIDSSLVRELLGAHDNSTALVIGPAFGQAEDARTHYEAAGYILAAAAVFSVVLMAWSWSKIEIAIALIKNASHMLGDMPLLPFFPITGFLLMGGLLYYWLLAVTNIMSVPGPNSLNGTATILAAMDQALDGFNADNVQQWAQNQTQRAVAFSHDLFHDNVVFDVETKLLSVFFVSCMVWWTFEVVRAVGVCTISGATSKLYWYKEGQTQDGHRFPIWGAFKRTVTYHFGSMIFGAAVLRLATVFIWTLGYLSEQMKLKFADGTTQTIAKVVRCCLRCMICCLQRFVKYLTASSYVIIAIQGGSFCAATRRAFILMTSQARLLAMNDFATDVLTTTITLTVALLCSTITFVVLKYSGEFPNWFFSHQGMTDVLDVDNPALPVLVTFIFSYVVSEAFVDVLQSTIEAVFLCYCADVKLNKQEGQLARNMLALEEIKQADRVVQEEEAKTQVAKAEAMYKARTADSNQRLGNITVQPSDPDDVADELDATWLQAGGNGDPMKRAFGEAGTESPTMRVPPLGAPGTEAVARFDANANGKGKGRRSKIVL